MTDEKPPLDLSQSITNALSGKIIQDITPHLNLTENVIIITEDKTRLCLIKHLKSIEAKERWFTPAGIFVAIGTTFATATFHDFLSLKATTWEAIFIVFGMIDFFWFIYAVIKAFKTPTIEDVVAEMKRATQAKSK